MTFSHNYNSLDLGKFIFAFAVVAIHTNPLVACNNEYILCMYNVLVRFAVPFFFIASGYLLASKFVFPLPAHTNLTRIQNQLKKITKMYLWWTLAYFPLALGHFLSTNTSFPKAFLIYVRGFIFVGEQYNSWPLWYLLATLYALILLWIVLKLKFSPTKLFCIWLGVTCISIGFDFLAKTDVSLPLFAQQLQLLVKYTTGNGRIFQGITYIPLGIVLYYKTLPKWFNWMLFITIGIALTGVQNNIVLTDILRILAAVGMFSLMQGISLKDRFYYPFLRNTSLFIYLIHMYIWTLYYTVVYGTKTYGLDSFIVTSLVSFLTASCWVFIKTKKPALFKERA